MTQYYNASIRNLTYRLRKFKDILEEELENEVKKHADEIVSLVSEAQLYKKGITGKGIKIKSYAPYKARTIRNKKRKGQPTSRVTLRDTGAFYESFYIVFDTGGFYITADDKKTEALVTKYGASIFRLTDQHLGYILRELIRPGLIAKLKQRL